MKDFIAFLSALAPDGETLLLVKQKRTALVHNDGTPKYVWPAVLPTAFREGGAWYANTASFITSRLDVRVSAAASNATHCLVMVLDDIGTKSKVPPLQPSWIIETSPGNFQYGYVFSLQPTTGDFSAAILAIAEAGYTDKGAINPVRNFRIPGSVNLKRDNFVAKLTTFNPELEYTLPEICAALGVVPDAADTTQVRSLRIRDDGKDDVLAWLDTRGDIMEPANSQGWYGVLCPNALEHSDGNTMGRYMAVNRSYTCFHQHCGDWDSRRFLSWVETEGGPKHQPGLRDTLIADVMANALAKLSPGDMFSDSAAAVLADIERRELGRLERKDWWARFAYVQADDTYFDIGTRRELSRGTFNALYRHINCRSNHTGRKIEASISFDEDRETEKAKTLAGITYAAGESVLVPRSGELFGNRWRNARPAVEAGSIQPWLDHCALLIPDAAEREHCYDVMAYRVQHPTQKINHAVLHGGLEGCGKDTMWAPMIWAVCGPQLLNRGIMDNDTVSSQWGYQLESEVLIINELREPDATQRRAFANKLKPIIAAPPEYLPVNRKGLHPYMMLNRIFVLAFSNDPSPISLSSQDRRWFCIWSDAPRMSPGPAAALWAWYAKTGFAAIGAWLHARDVAAFNPKAAPMETEFKLNLIEHGMSTAEAVLVDMMNNRRGEFAKGAVGSPFHVVCSKVSTDMPIGTKVPQAALLHALQEAGWKDMGRIASGDYPAKKHIFCAPALTHLTKSDLRRIIEDAPPKLSIVK
jgi:hypothetical protein